MAEEAQVKPVYDIDYHYAPVGLFWSSFWMSSIVLGLWAFFFISVASAYGHGPAIDKVKGLEAGIGVYVFLIVLSAIVAGVGRFFVKKGRDVRQLFYVSWVGVPVVSLIVAIIALSTVHPGK